MIIKRYVVVEKTQNGFESICGNGCNKEYVFISKSNADEFRVKLECARGEGTDSLSQSNFKTVELKGSCRF